MCNILNQLSLIVEKFNKESKLSIFKKSKVIGFNEVLSGLLLRIMNGYGYKVATDRLKYRRMRLPKEKPKKFTYQGLSQATQGVPSSFLRKMNTEIVDKFFVSKAGRMIAVDGSKLSLSKSLGSYKGTKFPLTASKSYRKGMLTVLYDIKEKIPIAYDLASHQNERRSFLDLMKYLKPHDFLIFDRGYYSKKLENKLLEAKCQFLFRIPNNILKKGLPLNTRKINCVIDGKEYNFFTNAQQYSDDQIKDLYHKRWEIEEYYKFLKGSLGGNNYKNYSIINSLEQALDVQWLISLLIGIMARANRKLPPTLNSPYYSLQYLEDFWIAFIFKPKGYTKILKDTVQHVQETCVIVIRIGIRKFPRRAIVNKGHWYRPRCN